PAPGGGVVRQGPGAVDGRHQAGVVGERDQAAGLGALARPVGVEDAVGGGVDGGGRAEGRVEDLGEVDGVVHHRAAAGEVHVGEPVPGGGELAVVGAGQPDHLAEGAVGEVIG